MTDPEHWPWFVKPILYPQMVAGAACGWLPLAKARKWRAAQIGLIAYFFLFGIVFVWKQPIVVVLILAVAALSLAERILSRGTWVLCTLASVERRLTKIRRES